MFTSLLSSFPSSLLPSFLPSFALSVIFSSLSYSSSLLSLFSFPSSCIFLSLFRCNLPTFFFPLLLFSSLLFSSLFLPSLWLDVLFFLSSLDTSILQLSCFPQAKCSRLPSFLSSLPPSSFLLSLPPSFFLTKFPSPSPSLSLILSLSSAIFCSYLLLIITLFLSC